MLAARLDDHVLLMTILNNMAEQDLRLGDLVTAATHQRDAMRLSTELGVPVMTAFALVLASRMAQPAGDDAAAVRLHAAADALPGGVPVRADPRRPRAERGRAGHRP